MQSRSRDETGATASYSGAIPRRSVSFVPDSIAMRARIDSQLPLEVLVPQGDELVFIVRACRRLPRLPSVEPRVPRAAARPSASISVSGRLRGLGRRLPFGRTVEGVHVGRIVLPHGQHELHVAFSERVHVDGLRLRSPPHAAGRRERRRWRAPIDTQKSSGVGMPGRYSTAPACRASGGSSKLTSVGLAAVRARREHHPVRLDAHQLRRLQVEDDHDRAADERLRLVRLGDAGDDRALAGAGVDLQLEQPARLGHALGRQHLGRRAARPS